MCKQKYSEGDLVIYDRYGICRVEEICTVDDVDEVDPGTLYYKMTPMEINGCTLYYAVAQQGSQIRPLMSREEVQKLIDGIPEIETLQVYDERKREKIYQEALKRSDPKALVQIIKTIYNRKTERIVGGRGMTSIDRKYFELAEERLYSELSVVLGIPKERMPEYLTEYLEDDRG